MTKLDLTKEFKNYYSAKTTPALETLGPACYLSICGKGDPSGEGFAEKIQALYPVAYQLKFAFKAKGKDFVVAKLEGLWWYDETRYSDVSISEAPKAIPREEWEYRLLIRIPDYVRREDVDLAVKECVAKKGNDLIREVTYFEMNEGNVVQMLHIGPFDTEPVSLGVIYDFILGHGFGRNGLHHEIYLSDFRKTPPEKLKTILREPVN
ncbi:GyrI-like domain-containing protein [Dyadobacter sp. MSC1_007]|jgi:hypothetical protein|uniref:GyrI-like domain-containing protein n=1 Tax=Dyadobacter sp. MSC1_007 TaxID=2909264 RepID=UPI0020304213|nr:GyrI-like domain-containing protein [Dyadobacter sp. MSC1_007]